MARGPVSPVEPAQWTQKPRWRASPKLDGFLISSLKPEVPHYPPDRLLDVGRLSYLALPDYRHLHTAPTGFVELLRPVAWRLSPMLLRRHSADLLHFRAIPPFIGVQPQWRATVLDCRPEGSCPAQERQPVHVAFAEPGYPLPLRSGSINPRSSQWRMVVAGTPEKRSTSPMFASPSLSYSAGTGALACPAIGFSEAPSISGLTRRRRSALLSTNTDDIAIAPAARIGESKTPRAG